MKLSTQPSPFRSGKAAGSTSTPNQSPFKSGKAAGSTYNENQSPFKSAKTKTNTSAQPMPMKSPKQGSVTSSDQMPFRSAKTTGGTNGTMSKFPALKGSAPMGDQMKDTSQISLKRKKPSVPKKKDAQVGAMVKLLGGKNSPFVGEGYIVG